VPHRRLSQSILCEQVWLLLFLKGTACLCCMDGELAWPLFCLRSRDDNYQLPIQGINMKIMLVNRIGSRPLARSLVTLYWLMKLSPLYLFCSAQYLMLYLKMVNRRYPCYHIFWFSLDQRSTINTRPPPLTI
jgi:hypothetical protein